MITFLIFISIDFTCLLSMTDQLLYIDPGSGSAIISAIIGFFVAVGIFFKTYFYKIKSFFTKSKSEEKT